ncbi:unnamed protein product [Protopolystoma xenopodis]|uniref:Uncharacterized protein n=1 Tax=Protopolystoma xenopodis TaxID=117903 RepID=A0A448XEF9_9PLAT|nr:unnamed protein product [Protopolystoma xenopodis]
MPAWQVCPQQRGHRHFGWDGIEPSLRGCSESLETETNRNYEADRIVQQDDWTAASFNRLGHRHRPAANSGGHADAQNHTGRLTWAHQMPYSRLPVCLCAMVCRSSEPATRGELNCVWTDRRTKLALVDQSRLL